MATTSKHKLVILPATKKGVPIGEFFINKPIGDWNKGHLRLERCERITSLGHSWSRNGIKTEIQHLYVLSDDDIKEGEWIYESDLKTINQAGKDYIRNSADKKIIATTDNLKIEVDGNRGDLLPDVSFDIEVPKVKQKFIEYFIEQYNKGNIITDVVVEYRNNSLTIKKAKDNWNRDEVETLLYRICDRFNVNTSEPIDKWIEENL
jgi:hypothetical protein